MTKQEHLLTIAGEEAGEVVQAVAKVMRFGKENCNPDSAKDSNEETLLTEFYQLQAMIEHMQEEGILMTLSEDRIERIKSKKLEKVYHYLDESKRVGTLKDE